MNEISTLLVPGSPYDQTGPSVSVEGRLTLVSGYRSVVGLRRRNGYNQVLRKRIPLSSRTVPLLPKIFFGGRLCSGHEVPRCPINPGSNLQQRQKGVKRRTGGVCHLPRIDPTGGTGVDGFQSSRTVGRTFGWSVVRGPEVHRRRLNCVVLREDLCRFRHRPGNQVGGLSDPGVSPNLNPPPVSGPTSVGTVREVHWNLFSVRERLVVKG